MTDDVRRVGDWKAARRWFKQTRKDLRRLSEEFTERTAEDTGEGLRQHYAKQGDRRMTKAIKVHRESPSTYFAGVQQGQVTTYHGEQISNDDLIAKKVKKEIGSKTKTPEPEMRKMQKELEKDVKDKSKDFFSRELHFKDRQRGPFRRSYRAR